MKRGKTILTITLLLLTINLISATYQCSGDLNKDIDGIAEGNRESINGLKIGLAKAEETPAINRIMAELILNSEILSVSSGNQIEFEISETTYNLTIINITGLKVNFNLDSSAESIEEKDYITMGDLEINLFKIEDPETKFIIGTNRLFLSSDDELEKLITINNKEYLIGLFSASDYEASIEVSLCANGNFTQVADIPEEPEINQTNTNQTQTNQTNTNQTQTDINQTEPNQTQDTSEINQTQTNPDPNQAIEKDNKLIIYFSIIAGIILLILIVATILFRTSSRNREDKKIADSINR